MWSHEHTEADMHGYQRVAVEFLEANPFSALFIDLGLGKTIICLTLLVKLFEALFEIVAADEQIEKVLVVAPLRVAAQTWPNEIPIWEHTAALNATVIRAEDDDAEIIEAGDKARAAARASLTDEDRTTAKAIEAIEEKPGAASRYLTAICNRAAGLARTAAKEELRRKRLESTASIHIINREKLEWIVDQYSEWRPITRDGVIRHKRKIVGWPYQAVIIDEISSFKDHSTARFKAMAAVRPLLKRFHGLTATPASESYMGIFAITYLLDRGERFGRAITHYREDYFNYDHRRMTYTLKKGAQEQISNKIADICLVMKAKDHLPGRTLYEPILLPRLLKLNAVQKEAYKRFETDFIYELPDGEIVEAVTGGALAGKLVQLASGALYNAAGQARYIHDHVSGDLEELVEELNGEPLLVAYWYKSSLQRLRKLFPTGVEMDLKGARVQPWNRGEFPIMFVHPAGVGHGLNMQSGPGHDIYWFDACYSLELFDQLNGRLARQGQKQRVRIHMPRVEATAHTVVYGKLDQKQDAQEALFAYIQSMRRRLAAKQAAA